jgi:hypothetical protein
MNISVNPEPIRDIEMIHPREPDPSVIKRNVADGIMNFIFIRLMGYLLSLLIAIIVIANFLEVQYSLIPMICSELFGLLVLAVYQQKIKREDTLYLFIFENFMYFIFLITIIININVGFEKMFLMIVPIFHVFINLMSVSYQNQKLGVPVFFINNLVFYSCFLFVLLKVKNILDISFYVCFWPFYLFAFIFMMVIIKQLIDFITKKYYNDTNKLEIMFRLSGVILGLAFLATHILSIIYLASKIFKLII